MSTVRATQIKIKETVNLEQNFFRKTFIRKLILGKEMASI